MDVQVPDSPSDIHSQSEEPFEKENNGQRRGNWIGWRFIWKWRRIDCLDLDGFEGILWEIYEENGHLFTDEYLAIMDWRKQNIQLNGILWIVNSAKIESHQFPSPWNFQYKIAKKEGKSENFTAPAKWAGGKMRLPNKKEGWMGFCVWWDHLARKDFRRRLPPGLF